MKPLRFGGETLQTCPRQSENTQWSTRPAGLEEVGTIVAEAESLPPDMGMGQDYFCKQLPGYSEGMSVNTAFTKLRKNQSSPPQQ